jgi:hypothetical protein
MSTESPGTAPNPGGNAAHNTATILVNGVVISLADKTPTARQILVAADFTPADECILVQLADKASSSLGVDEVVNLKGHGTEVFRAFRGDRVFRFTLGGLGCDWGDKTITEPELRAMGEVDEDKVIILVRDGRDRVLGEGDVVELNHQGTEHLRVEPGFVTVKYDGNDVRIERGRYKTEALIAFFHVPAGYLLNVVDEHNMLVPLKPGETIRVKNGMKFVSQPPGGASS